MHRTGDHQNKTGRNKHRDQDKDTQASHRERKQNTERRPREQKGNRNGDKQPLIN